MLLMDRPGEREVYVDEKQEPISLSRMFLCVCAGMSPYWDTLIVVGIVNRRSHGIPPHLQHGGPIRWFHPDEKQSPRISSIASFNHCGLAGQRTAVLLSCAGASVGVTFGSYSLIQTHFVCF